jgi:peptidoglycan hydrolase-like protein with peptidoglycan-binding domain
MENSADQAQPLKLQAAAIRRLPTLSFGDSGDSVKVLQRLLSQNGYPVRVDGNFGALTETAVKAFQTQNNLTVDGIVGSRTWRELTR